MKSFLRTLFVVVAMFAASSASHAQLFELSGHVTGVTGSFLDYFAPGDPIKVSFDLTPPLEDAFQGGAAFQGVALYNRNVDIRAAIDVPLPLPAPPGVFFFDAPHATEGLTTSMTWASYSPHSPAYLQAPFLLPLNYSLPPGSFRQDFVSLQDILPSLSEFPSNVPLTKFSNTSGHYELKGFPVSPFAGGRIDWTVTEYQFGGNSFTPVPEPGYVGVAGMIFLGMVAARRWWCAPRGRDRLDC